ncbi:IS30 family transposase [Maribacter sp. ACAM166]|uniref:IS30 family transposase n=1 Tax=Maribacter sp. ACAM166 TaxID=2508996 RepID=UPI0010FF1A9F|nr:IS30 family transposase [Maribacter sp. ACAM166]TLP81221.1 IS30 family transposase [Maribacter sp. ACAM166]
MNKYKQLTPDQRYQIQALLRAEIGKTAIAGIIGVHPATIYRELKRNTAKRGRTAGDYVAENAQRRTVSRHKCKFKRVLLTEVMKERIAGLLRFEKWSPELISKRLELEGESCVSHETIYQWIWDVKKSKKKMDAKYSKIFKSLRHGSRRRKRGNIKDRRGAIKGRVGIDERPDIVNHRERIGDIEVDLMMGSEHKSALLVMTDRATLITMIEKLKGKEASEVYDKMERRLTNFNSSWIKTLTFDNGKEFAQHQKIGKLLNARTYFTRPYTSQDKGTVENRIGVIRRFFPKKTDLRKVTDKRIKEVERLLNYRPIRKFNYHNPIETLKNKCFALMG